MQSHRELPSIAADTLLRLRERTPRVHCITNAVAQALTANVLLAAGAIPSMTIARREVAGFAQRADALLVNLGTFDPERQAASLAAVAALNKARKPWVLDPVLIDRSPSRAAFARKLVGKSPHAVRLNSAEFAALTGCAAEEGELIRYGKSKKATLGLTGATDLITDGARLVRVANGHPLMSKVTAMGCAASALVAAFLAVESDAWLATAGALIVLGVAGEIAGASARGPGSFGAEILDAIHRLDRETVMTRAKVSG